jgi:hypothetical protein
MPKLVFLLLLPVLLCACAGTTPSGFGDRDADADEGPTVYGQISVSVDAINHD